MDAISYSHARKHLVQTMEQVCDDHSPVIVTRQNARAVVIMSLDDYNAIQETAYLLKSQENADRLRESLKQAADGKFIKRSIIDDDSEETE